MSSKRRISADEINCLIYGYLQDSGFEHSSYALRNEARLDYSQHASIPLRRGELVDLLSKALLYTEVESHWNMDPNIHCHAPFSLLLPHKCSFDAADSQPSPASPPYRSTQPELFPYTNGTTYTSPSTAQKRKASSMSFSDIRPEKRICVSEDVDMHLASDVQKSTENGRPAISLDEKAMAADVKDTSGVSNRVDKPKFPMESTNQMKECPVVLLHGHEAEVFTSAWNPVYPDLLATGSKDSTIRIWSLQNVKLKVEKNANSLDGVIPEFQPSYPDPVVLSHTDTKRSEQSDITGLDWSPDGNLLATGSYDSSLRVWNKNGEVYMIQTRHSSFVVSVQFSPSGKYLLSASLDGVVCVWNMVSRTLHIKFHVESKCLDTDWLDDSTFVTCSSSRDIRMFSIHPDDAFQTVIQSDQALRIFTGHTSEINQVKFNKDRSLLASCSDDSTARIWTHEAWANLRERRPLSCIPSDSSMSSIAEPSMSYEAEVTLLGHSSSISAIQWCPTMEGNRQVILATCSFDKTARLWNTSDGSCLRVLDSSSQPLYSITFDPTGRYLATGSKDGHLYIYDTETGEIVQRWPTSGSGVGPVFDVNWQKIGGSYLAMCLESKFVAIMDTTILPRLLNHQS